MPLRHEAGAVVVTCECPTHECFGATTDGCYFSSVIPCESCGDPTDEGGCFCDGHAFCASCLHNCPACLASMKSDWSLT